MQTHHDLRQGQRPYPRRRQLDRQRYSVEATADFRDRRSRIVVAREIGCHSTRPIDKQLHGFVGQRQRRHPPGHLTGNPDGLPAGGKQSEAAGSAEQREDQLRNGVEQMLTIVEHDEHLATGDEPQQRVHRRAARLVRQAKCAGHRNRHRVWVGDRCQIDPPDTAVVLACDLARDLHRQPGLANPAGPGQGHQPLLGQQLADMGHPRITAHEIRQLHR